MRVACWMQAVGAIDHLAGEDVTKVMHTIAILDLHPRRAARRRAEATTEPAFALADDMHGQGVSRPFKDEHAYSGGLPCAEYTYRAPPKEFQPGERFEVEATTHDGVVLLYSNSKSEHSLSTKPFADIAPFRVIIDHL